MEHPSEPSRQQRSPIGEALALSSRIMAVGLAMFLPAVAGSGLDGRLGTSFFGLIGLVAGFVLGLWWLVHLNPRGGPKPSPKPGHSGQP